MEVAQSSPARRLDLCDAALLAAFVVMAVLGTWNRVLLINDGAYFLSVGWLGDAWDLYFSQFAGRAVSLLATFGPVWAIRWVFHPSGTTYIALAHVCYFATPLGLWLAIRAVEPSRVFSRLYLAAMLALVYFPSEAIVGAGLWMTWVALLAGPPRPPRQAVLITCGFAPVMAFTHPATAMMSMLYFLIGASLTLAGRPFPRHTLKAAAAMSLLLLAAYVATSRLLPSTNPTIIEMQAMSGSDYVDPRWMLVTLALFPMLAVLWLLMLAPGVAAANPRLRLPPLAIVVAGVLGLWFAANGTSLFTYLFARYTVSHVLAAALALALTGPAAGWLTRARRPLMWCAAITTVAALSYNVDIALFGRFVDQHLAPGFIDVDRQPSISWPKARGRELLETRTYFKWAAGSNYVRDVVLPDYERYRQVLAFISFFRSDRQAVLFHRLPAGNWIPFECAPVRRALARAHDESDRRFLAFLGENYCVQ